MKLRNKKTGEIITCGAIDTLDLDMGSMKYFRNYGYSSLAELNENWEDYEEPKEFWFVDSGGEVEEATYLTDNDKSSLRSFGNYFETKEEAEEAVEKLRAWKRLKDRGFKFTYWNGGARQINFEIRNLENEYYIPRQICDDLELLFGDAE